jgi:hypothetical protein
MTVLLIAWAMLGVNVVLMVGNWILIYRNRQIRKTYERLIAGHEGAAP